MLDPDAIALSYWNVLQQPRSAWSWELEVRAVGGEVLIITRHSGAHEVRTRTLVIPGSMQSPSSGRASRGPGGIAPE